MRLPNDTLRGWLVPAALVATATLLTVPWSYWVIKAAYDRDVIENARALARRVELRVLTQQNYSTAPQQASEALAQELIVDPTVQTAAFFDLRYPSQPVGWTRLPGTHERTFPKDEVRRRTVSGITVEQAGDTYSVSIPWVQDNRPLGFTYLEFSKAALAEEFWHKEGSLVTRVIGLTAAAILVLSLVGIYAYGTRMKMGYVKERAELARQGLLAERGLTAAVLAHEIRNPLAALRFQLHSLRKNSADTTRVSGTADMIDAELSRIQQLVSDYLEHEKARSMRVQRVDLEQAARGLQALMTELFKDKRTELLVVPPPAPTWVTCDPHALRQVLMNLVLNAQQAMGPGGRVTLRLGRDDAAGFGTLDVADNGPGIPAEIRDRLFKPFATTKREGHGIGLALVKRFVDNFGGSVSVESEAGKGTTFHLRLPLAEVMVDQGLGRDKQLGPGFEPTPVTAR
jgi:signal transduction histidine kinase